MKELTKSPKAFFIRQGRLHPAWRAGLYFLVYLTFVFTVQFAVIFAWLTVILLQGQSFEDVMSRVDADLMSLKWLLPLSVIQAVLVVGLTFLFRRFIDRRSFKGLGLATTPGWIGETLMGLLMGFGVMFLIFALEWVTGMSAVHLASTSMPRLALRLAGYAVMYAAVGLTEELMFRGYLLQTLREWPGTVVAVALTSLTFGLLHACNPNVSPLALAYLVLAGLVFAYAYLTTGRLWWPIAMHFSWNFFQGPVFGLPVSGVPPDGIFVLETTGPAWITGGEFGPEAGVTGLAALGFITAAIWAWGRIAGRRTVGDGLPADD